MSVAAVLGYNGNPIGERPYWGAPESGRGSNIIDVHYDMNITDMRSLPSEKRKELTIDTCGFEVLEHESVEKDFNDEKRVKSLYYKESEELFKKATGCSRVMIFDHTIRKAKWGQDSKVDGLGPAMRVHVDQTTEASIQRVKDNMGDDAERLLKGRFQIVNLWRPIRGPVKSSPLAMADYRTLDVEKDTIPSDVYFPTRTGQSLSIRYNPSHTWYYMSDMQPNQVILLKCFESEAVEGRSIMTPHTAFTHPDTPEGWPTRQSIELRALLFYED